MVTPLYHPTPTGLVLDALQAGEITATDLAVWLAVSERCDLIARAGWRNGAHPSLAWLAGRTGLARRSVQRSLRRLEAAALVRCQRGGGRRASTYAVPLPVGGDSGVAPGATQESPPSDSGVAPGATQESPYRNPGTETPPEKRSHASGGTVRLASPQSLREIMAAAAAGARAASRAP